MTLYVHLAADPQWIPSQKSAPPFIEEFLGQLENELSSSVLTMGMPQTIS
jgi:hypothetical protein